MKVVCDSGSFPWCWASAGITPLDSEQKTRRGYRSGATGAYQDGETMQDVDLETDDDDESSR